MGTCKDCKFWGLNLTNFCNKIDDVQTPNKEFFLLDSGAADYYGPEAKVVTGPDFGCVLWEGREG